MKRAMAALAAAALIAGTAFMIWAHLPAAAGKGPVNYPMEQTTMQLRVSSPAFEDGGRIPARYTADGDDVSPALAWAGAPPGVSEFAIICHDPDAPGGPFTHWVIYGIPGSYDHLDDGVMQVAELDNGAMQGKNHFGKIGYGGPSPPKGRPHHYRFRVYALDAKLDLPSGISKDELRKAMQGHVIAEGEIVGLYGR